MESHCRPVDERHALLSRMRKIRDKAELFAIGRDLSRLRLGAQGIGYSGLGATAVTLRRADMRSGR